jgi:hypothetical protein
MTERVKNILLLAHRIKHLANDWDRQDRELGVLENETILEHRADRIELLIQSHAPLKLIKAPRSVFFFPNGMAAVCDFDGQQIGPLQGRHAFTVSKLKEIGYDWHDLPEVQGSPQL